MGFVIIAIEKIFTILLLYILLPSLAAKSISRENFPNSSKIHKNHESFLLCNFCRLWHAQFATIVHMHTIQCACMYSVRTPIPSLTAQSYTIFTDSVHVYVCVYSLLIIPKSKSYVWVVLRLFNMGQSCINCGSCDFL